MNTHKYLCCSALSFTLAALPLKVMAQWEELCDGYLIDIQPLPELPEEDPTAYFDLVDFNETTAQKITEALNIPGSSFEIIIKTEDTVPVKAKMRRHSFSRKSTPDSNLGFFIQNFRDKIRHSSSAGHSPDSSFEGDSGHFDFLPIDETLEEEDGISIADGSVPAETEDRAYRQTTLEITESDINTMRPLAERLRTLQANNVLVIPDEPCGIPDHEDKNLADFLSELHEGFWRNEKAAELCSNAFICIIEELSGAQKTYEFFSWLNCVSGQSWVGILDQCNQEYNLVINN